MEKEFVRHEISLELKQLGFDEPCLGYYNTDPYLKTPVFNMVKPFDHEWCLPAPLYQQVFRWFREKYGVHSSPEKFDEKTWWVEWGGWNSSICETYEEAEHEWLLKLIELVKESI